MNLLSVSVSYAAGKCDFSLAVPSLNGSKIENTLSEKDGAIHGLQSKLHHKVAIIVTRQVVSLARRLSFQLFSVPFALF